MNECAFIEWENIRVLEIYDKKLINWILGNMLSCKLGSQDIGWVCYRVIELTCLLVNIGRVGFVKFVSKTCEQIFIPSADINQYKFNNSCIM